MIGFEASEIINDTPENVYAFIEDTDLAPLWLIKVIKTENLTEGPLRAGTRFRETRMVGNREATGIIDIVRHDGPPTLSAPPYYHSGASSVMGAQVIYHYTFEAAGDQQTRVTLQCEVKPLNFFGRFTGPMMLGVLKREDGDQLTFLKKAIEDDFSEEDE